MTEPLSAEEKQRQFLERARKGVLQFVIDKGGVVNLGEMHDYSFQKFFIQHQGFSKLMEGFVDEKLVDYDPANQDVFITEAGRNYVKGN